MAALREGLPLSTTRRSSVYLLLSWALRRYAQRRRTTAQYLTMKKNSKYLHAGNSQSNSAAPPGVKAESRSLAADEPTFEIRERSFRGLSAQWNRLSKGIIGHADISCCTRRDPSSDFGSH